MPDTSYAFKTDEETKEKIRHLVDGSGITSKDFFSNLITMYELQKAKESTPILIPDIDELESLTKRINTIFINVSERIKTQQRESTEEQEQQTKNNQSTIELLQQRINGFEQSRLDDEDRIKLFIEEKKQAEKRASEFQNRIKELDEIVKGKSNLIEEYKQKNDNLNSIISEYKASADENKNLINEVNHLKSVNECLQRKIDDLSKEQKRLFDAHKIELETENKRLTLQKNTELLELRQDLQTKLELQQEKHIVAINEYENKVKELLNQQSIPEKVKTPATKKATRTKKESESVGEGDK